MRIFEFERELELARPLDEVFPFFADARNLERITPPWLRFHVETPGEIELREGALIDYRLRIRGIPVRWRSEITAWEPPHRFVDEQRKGPYRLWHHTHTFEARGERTLARDRVRLAVPGGWFAWKLLVERDVRTIFDYRSRVLRDLFGA